MSHCHTSTISRLERTLVPVVPRCKGRTVARWRAPKLAQWQEGWQHGKQARGGHSTQADLVLWIAYRTHAIKTCHCHWCHAWHDKNLEREGVDRMKLKWHLKEENAHVTIQAWMITCGCQSQAWLFSEKVKKVAVAVAEVKLLITKKKITHGGCTQPTPWVQASCGWEIFDPHPHLWLPMAMTHMGHLTCDFSYR